MLPDRVSNPGPLNYESGTLPIALRGTARYSSTDTKWYEAFKYYRCIYNKRPKADIMDMPKRGNLILKSHG